VKLPARKSSRKRTQQDYANLNSGLHSDPNRWTKILEGKDIKDDNFRRMKGTEVDMEWLQGDDGAMREPIVVEEPDGLGMKMPEKADFGIDDVARIVGEETPVEVIGM
jgi:F-box and leucine-rich repeat protein 10/11